MRDQDSVSSFEYKCCKFVEFLACVHLHTDEGDLAEISKTKTIRMVPLLCGLASRCFMISAKQCNSLTNVCIQGQV